MMGLFAQIKARAIFTIFIMTLALVTTPGALIITAIAFVVAALVIVIMALPRRSSVSGLARGLVGLSAAIAGQRRTGGAEEWAAHLASPREDGRLLTRREQWRHAGGFLLAAVRLRSNDATSWASRALDWVLSTDVRVAYVSAALMASAVANLYANGGYVRVIENGENLLGIAVLWWGIVVGLRRIRGIDATARKPAATRPAETEPSADVGLPVDLVPEDKAAADLVQPPRT